jgi:hypothetical protein
MPKPNYGFEKRRKELEKKQKQEQKAQRKLEKKNGTDTASDEDAVDD